MTAPPCPFAYLAPLLRRGRRSPLTCNRYAIGVATMVMLVALRLAIGWHFFKEGLSHRIDPTWTSEGFLKQAKGPLAANYQAVVPKFHDWDRLILAPLPDNNSAASDDAAEAAPPPSKDKAADK